VSQEFQICPSCEAEFTMAVSVCSDCGAELVSPDSMPAAEPEEFPPIGDLSLVRVSPLAWMRLLSEQLSDAGIPHRVERGTPEAADGEGASEKFGFETVYGTYVLPDDYEEAAVLDGELFARLEAAAGEESEVEVGEGQECPACETPLPEGESECPECGLHFPDAE